MELFDGLFLIPLDIPTTSLLAQSQADVVPVPVAVPEPVPIYGPQFLIALLSGVILAFGFQLLLTNLSIATGVSYVAHSSNDSSSSSSSSSGGMGIKKIGLAFGLWTLITVSLALFFACWLAIRLTAYGNPFLGAVTGLVIWATYFTLLMWFSSTTVGSLIGSVVSSATSGFQTIMGTAAAALGAKGASNQVVQTAEAAAAAVRRELSEGIDTTAIQDSLQGYIASLRSPEVDAAEVEREFERLVRNSEVAGVDRDALPHVDRDMFVKLLSDRTNLSKEETRRLANRLYRVWRNNTGSAQGLSELMDFVATASGSQLASQGLTKQLSKLVGEIRKQRQAQGGGDSSPSPIQQVASQGLSSLVGMVMGKVDLSDIDANTIIRQIKSAQKQITDQASSAAPQSLKSAMPTDDNIVRADVENYIQHAYISELKSPELESHFRNVLYDAEANETEMRKQLSDISRQLFTECLSARGMLTQAEIKDIATRMEIIRQGVLKDVTAAETIGAEKRIRQQAETFFQYTPADELASKMGEDAFRAIIEGEPMDTEQMRSRLGQLNADYFRQFLVTRNDVPAHETAERYEQVLQRTIADAEGLDKAAKVRLQQQQQSLEDYLRNTGKSELNPEGIKRDIQTILNEPDQGIQRVRGRLAQFDRDTFVKLLSERPEFSEREVDQVLNTVEENWSKTLNAPQKLTAQAQQKYDEATSAIADYLRSTGKPELSPEGIERDIRKLMNHPKAGMQAIRFRLSKMDRDTLVQLLNQRDDLTEEEINSTIDSILSTVQNIIKSPRRLARRAQSTTQSQARSFQSSLEDYLSNTNKEELNPTGIKRDLKLLLNDPKLGASKLSDRIAQMDDSTMVALLAQRPDMTREEAAEVVGRIADVRHQITGQIRSVQRSLESVIESIFASIRDYLQSLDRPELDYYGIKQDVRTLFDDPQAGLSAMRDRLSQFDRNTLVALVSSHDRIAESDAHRVIDQIESARDSVLHKAESVEKQVEQRINAVKAQTHQQMEATKTAAVAAAWWLFGTALISAIVSAVGGSLAIAS
ncbi:MAG: MFS transporter [Cyanobacteria bacterium J06614_10]